VKEPSFDVLLFLPLQPGVMGASFSGGANKRPGLLKNPDAPTRTVHVPCMRAQHVVGALTFSTRPTVTELIPTMLADLKPLEV
jgi:hypothetical protein